MYFRGTRSGLTALVARDVRTKLSVRLVDNGKWSGLLIEMHVDGNRNEGINFA